MSFFSFLFLSDVRGGKKNVHAKIDKILSK